MMQFLQFAVLGVGAGATYVLLSQGLVVINQGSGVLNLSHGSMALVATYVYQDLRFQSGWGLAPSLIVSIGGMAVVGALVYHLVMRPLGNASSIAKVVTTLGLLVIGQSAVALIWGVTPLGIRSFFPTNIIKMGTIIMPVDRIYLLAIAFALTVGLWGIYRFSRFGLAVKASAANPEAAAALGWSPHVLATATWALGSACAAMAGILIAPLASVSIADYPLLILPATAAALVGGFTSFWLTFIGSVGIGIAQAEIINYVPDTVVGAQWSIPFAIVVLILAIRGKGLPTRGYVQERLPLVGTGVIQWRYLLPVCAAFIFVLSDVASVSFLRAAIVSFSYGVIMLSVVVLLGYTAQLSFEQMAMAGLATLVAARAIYSLHWPFELAFVAGVVVAVPIGVLFALPALRTRGVNLAVVTLGLGVTLYQMVLTHPDWAQGVTGFAIGNLHIFGIDMNSITHPQRYAVVVFVVFVICSVGVANIRRGKSGSALVAVRSNERSAAALGISVFQAKLFAFTVGSTVAAIGGMLLAFRNPVVHIDEFDPFQSVLIVSYAVLGGVGLILGPVNGGLFIAGGLGAWIYAQFSSATDAGFWLALAGGILVVVLVILHPDGSASIQARQWHSLLRLAGRVTRRPPAEPVVESLPEVEHHVAVPATLEVDGLTVRFGGVTAVDDVSLTVRPGEVVGLIGPNGAGKTTLIDVVTGFVRPAAGVIRLNGEPVQSWPAHRRARAGLSRSFQQLELFERSSVRDNLRVASDSRAFLSYALDVVHPGHRPLSDAATAAIRTFQLTSLLDTDVTDLPYGFRRLTAIARAIAVSPSILLLDEPAAGLDSREAHELGEIVRRLADEWGFGILLVDHDMPFVLGASDRVIVLDFGRKIAEGTPAEVRANQAVIDAYLGEPEPAQPAAALTGATS